MSFELLHKPRGGKHIFYKFYGIDFSSNEPPKLSYRRSPAGASDQATVHYINIDSHRAGLLESLCAEIVLEGDAHGTNNVHS